MLAPPYYVITPPYLNPALEHIISIIIPHVYSWLAVIWLLTFGFTTLIQRPLLAQSVTAAFLFGAGDIIAQQAIERQGKHHDVMRTARLTFYGGALFGPALTKWYQLLNRIKFTSPTRGVIYRVWLDQALLTPVAVGFFFGTMSILEGKGISGATNRISENYQSTLLRNWGVFIPAQIINFSIVPPHLRFGFVSVVSLFWNTYLSAVNAQTKEDKGTYTE